MKQCTILEMIDGLGKTNKLLISGLAAAGVLTGLLVWAKVYLPEEGESFIFILEKKMGSCWTCGEFIHFSSQVWSSPEVKKSRA